ncbi:MAG: sulfatase-like hydrolase/transferase, partial [Planctomycetota bacterium]
MSEARKPNVLLILMDDMGFSDLGCYGGEIDTPNIDALARRGVRFTQCYNTGRCWPTRACTMTGYYAPQVHMDPPGKTPYRPAWQRLLPDYLRQLGYRSYHSGKWHINNVPDPGGEDAFDVSWGFNIEQFSHFFDSDDGSQFSATAITDHALGCLRDHAANHGDAPFFQYVAHTTPHFPLHAESDDIAKYLDRYDEGWD